MSCTYTGALVHFDEYGFQAWGDLYAVADAIIIRWNKDGQQFDSDTAMAKQAPTHHVTIGMEGWHRPDLGLSVVPVRQLKGPIYRE